MLKLIKRLSCIAFFIVLAAGAGFCQDAPPDKEEEAVIQKGEINSEDINIRADSTVSATVICNIDKGQYVDIVSQVFDWYKIRLPRNAPSYIRGDFIKLIEAESKVKQGQLVKNNVNVRLKPDINSAVLGKAHIDETVTIVGKTEDWYKIEPVNNSYGWVHKNFVDKLDTKKIKVISKPKPKPEMTPEVIITVEGIIKTKTITKVATHKLISTDDKVFLLKGNSEEFAPLNRKKVKLTGKLLEPTDPSNPPFIEVQKIEVLD